jgi:hypothetical protein
MVPGTCQARDTSAELVASILRCLLSSGLHHRAGSLTRQEQTALRLFRLCAVGQIGLQLRTLS